MMRLALTSLLLIAFMPVQAETLSCADPAFASEESLKKHFGASNVRSDDIGVGEGETESGTVVFSKDQKRRLDILWKDAKRKRGPAMIRFNGTGWRTSSGIGVRDSLSSVEKRNGKPFTLLGFAWDYGGTAGGWNGGKLAKADRPCELVLVFAPHPDPHSDERRLSVYHEVTGEQEFSSDHPAMKKLTPRVTSIELTFRD